MASDLRSLLSARLKKLVPLNGAAPAHERGPHRAEVIAVAASKGGVGKTTTAVSLAAGLAKFHERRVLLADLDSQGHVATSFRGTVPAHLPHMSDILLEGPARRRELLEAAYPSAIAGLDLIGSDKTLNQTESLLSTKIGKEFILRSAIEVTRTHYDFIVFDCPPNLGNLTLNALSAADHLIIPSDLTVLSLEGVGDLLGAVETIRDRLNHRLNVLGILPTRVDRRNKSINEVMEQSLDDLYGDFVFEAEIPVNTAVNRAQLEGITVYEYEPSAKASVAYAAFVDEVLAKLGHGEATEAKRA
jgi:chromosome partitioning protein